MATEQLRSRRLFLSGIGTALVGAVAARMAHPGPTLAMDGDAVHVGDELTGTSVTTLTVTTPGETAVRGSATGDGVGLYGTSPSGAGVVGYIGTDPVPMPTVRAGVFAAAPKGTGAHGVALATSGRVRFSTSGVERIGPGRTSKTVDPHVNVGFVLLTSQTDLRGRQLWVTRNANNTFTIRMSAPHTRHVFVAWLMLS